MAEDKTRIESTDADAAEDAGKLAEQALNSAQQAVEQLSAATGDAAAGSAAASDKTSGGGTSGGGGGAGRNVDLPNFQKVLADVEAGGLDLLHDVDLHVRIELGRTHMLVEDVLRLAEGSVVELDKLAGDPVDVFVNDRLVARGEVLVLNDNFCVRISEIVGEVASDDDDKPEENPQTKT
ncbi:MAG: flagellar motor switch protein FliN [Phycisphaeraceae bacterium]